MNWDRRLSSRVLVILAFATGLLATWVALYFVNQPILEAHGFRQTQTALTSYWFMHEGWQLNYQTPVAGYPWSIPFEFPIYQSLVSLIAWLGNFPLDPTGRLVSFFFLLACAWPAYKIHRQLGLNSDTFWIFCILLWSSPIYLFWSRTFMIETTALFFAIAAIPYGIDLFDSYPRWQSSVLFSFWVTLGALQKITTAASVIMIVGIIFAINHLITIGIKLPSLRTIFILIIALLVPVIITALWTHYTDVVKGQNLLGAQLTSDALREWNFGPLEQRLDPGVWKTILWDRVFVGNAGGLLGISILGAALLFGEQRTKKLILISLVLFLLPISIFLNLHFVHDYYQTSSTFFLIGALAISIAHFPSAIPPKGLLRVVATLFPTLMLLVCNIKSFTFGYFTAMQILFDVSGTPALAVGDLIRRYTPESSGIVVFGNDWNSDIAYYSERKSFTVPEWFSEYEDVWMKPSTFIGDKELGAVVFCGSMIEEYADIQQIVNRADVKAQPDLFKVNGCYLWLPGVKKNALPGSDH